MPFPFILPALGATGAGLIGVGSGAAASAGMSSALIGLAGTALASGANMYMVGKTNRENRKLAELQYERQKKDIAAQNNYNSPSSQVVRLRAAGLSPAMFYGGNASGVAGEQNNIPSYDNPDLVAPSFDASAVRDSFVDLSRLEVDRSSSQIKDKYVAQQTQKLAQDFQRDMELNPEVITKAKQENATARVNHQILEEQLKQETKNTLIAGINVDLAAQNLNVSKFALTSAILKLPKELYNMDADTALKWFSIHKGEKDIELAFAQLAETRRHNMENEWNDAANRGLRQQEINDKNKQFYDSLKVQVFGKTLDYKARMNTSVYGAVNTILDMMDIKLNGASNWLNY